jgi:anti-anti-sigma regulatory factor
MSNVSKKDDTLDWIKGTEKQSADADEDVSGDIVLKGALGIAEAEAMHHRLSRVLDANVDISIQSEDLSRVDAAGAQLLYALVKEAKSRSVSLKWESVSDALQETTDMLGLSEGMGFAADA